MSSYQTSLLAFQSKFTAQKACAHHLGTLRGRTVYADPIATNQGCQLKS
jgi:hypothetical protein